MEIKVTKTGYFTKKKVLEIGLQAANQIKVVQIQTNVIIEFSILNLLQPYGECYCSVRS